MIPIVAGLALGALMGGGIAALQKKDILQGALMGGVGGALGGAFMPGVAGAVAPVAEGAVAGTVSGATGGAGATSSIMAGAPGAGVLVNNSPLLTQAIAPAVAPSFAPAAVAGAGGGGGGLGSFLGANKYVLGGGALGGMLAGDKEPNPANQGNIYTTEFSQERNPEFGVTPGASYFTQGYGQGTYSKAKDYDPTMTAATGGLVALAEGGQALELEPYRAVETNRYATPARAMTPEVAAYNQQMMARANQQYNVNPRPLPIQVPGSPGYVAPTYNAPVSSDAGGDLAYDPVTRRYTGIGGLAKKEMTELERMREEMDAMRGEQMGYGGSNEGGVANGGLMRGYNMGGLSSLGAYSDGGQLLKGPGDGVSDDIPAQIGARQPARLADGEFVVPARIVSELGNGSTDAGAKRLYAMMDRVQKGRKKSVGKGKVAVDSKAHKMLPA